HAIINRDFSGWYIDIFGCFIQKGYFNIFWFFGALIIIYLFLPIIHRIYKTRVLSVIFLILLVIASVTIYEISVIRCCNGNSMISQNVIQTFRLWTHLTYFVGGAFLYRIRKRFSEVSACIIIPFLVIAIFVLVAYCFFMGTCVLSTSYAEYMYDAPVVILITSFLFIAFGAFKFHGNSLPILSTATMGIYILHYNFVYPVIKYFSSGNLAYVFMTPVLVFTIGLLVSIILCQTRYVNKVI
ncbi:MAG: acyltransferase family protein, partial [Clostridia bacterium]|nr:acyltransferase family protein [Clostridia bacterium]